MKYYLQDLLGRSKENAIANLIADNIDYRITREDNTNYMITCDFDIERINLEIEKDIVVSAELG